MSYPMKPSIKLKTSSKVAELFTTGLPDLLLLFYKRLSVGGKEEKSEMIVVAFLYFMLDLTYIWTKGIILNYSLDQKLGLFQVSSC